MKINSETIASKIFETQNWGYKWYDLSPSHQDKFLDLADVILNIVYASHTKSTVSMRKSKE